MSARNLVMKLLGVAALASLAGCATAPRSYYSDGGDYYYGTTRADVVIDYSSSYGYPGWSYGLGGYGGGYGYGGGFGYYGGYGGYYGGGYAHSPWWGYGGYYPGWNPNYPQAERRARVDPDIAFRQGASGRNRAVAPRSAGFAPDRYGASSIRQSDRSSRTYAPRREAVASSGYAPTSRSGMSDNRMAPLSGVGPRVQSNPVADASRRSMAPRNDSFQPRSAPARSAPRAAPVYRSAPAPSRAPSQPSRSQPAPTRK